MIFLKNLFVSIIFFQLAVCSSVQESSISNKIVEVENIPLKISRTYISDKAPENNSSEEILQMMESLVKGVLKKDLSQLPKFVLKEKGIYLDLKGLWTYDELVKEMGLKDSYFSVFFFESDKLKKHKKTPDVLTVRELLILSGGLDLDLFFE